MRPSPFLPSMINVFKILFSSPVAMLAGIVSIGALFFLISEEKSVQPLRNHLWAEEMISVPLAAGTNFQQELIVPAGLVEETFLLGLFFGCQGGACAGGAEVTLSQGSHEQTHTVEGLNPAPTLRHRFLSSCMARAVNAIIGICLPVLRSLSRIIFVASNPSRTGIFASMSIQSNCSL